MKGYVPSKEVDFVRRGARASANIVHVYYYFAVATVALFMAVLLS